MKIKTTVFVTIFILISSCGFKIIDQDFSQDYSIVEVNISGDPKISHLIRKKIKKDKTQKSNSIKINITNEKLKGISEKNIQNEITKYELTIKTKIEALIINTNKTIKFSISRSGDYSVEDRNTTTLKNEKNLTKSLVNNITDQIYRDLQARVNDF